MVLIGRVAMGSRKNRKIAAKYGKYYQRPLGFGVHAACPRCDVQAEYLRWCLTEFPKNSPNWLIANNELTRRERAHDQRCYEADAPARLIARQFKVLTGSKASKNRMRDSIASKAVDIGDGVSGSISPWGIRYPDGWDLMTRGERSAWKRRASEEFLKKPLGVESHTSVGAYLSKKKSPLQTSVKPAITQRGESDAR